MIYNNIGFQQFLHVLSVLSAYVKGHFYRYYLIISGSVSNKGRGRGKEDEGKRGVYSPFQKQEGTRSLLPAQGLARGWGL